MFQKLNANLLWAEGISIDVFWFNSSCLGRVDFVIHSQSSDLTDSVPLTAYGDLFSLTLLKAILLLKLLCGLYIPHRVQIVPRLVHTKSR